MRLYAITSTPVDGQYTVAHVWAGNATLAQEYFAGVYPDLVISDSRDVFEENKPGMVAERFSVPEPKPEVEDAEPKRRKRGAD